MYASSAPLTNYFGEPYISFNISFSMVQQPTLGYYHTQVLVLTKDERNLIGIPWRNSRYYCCYNDMVEQGLCSAPGTVITNMTEPVYMWTADWYNVTNPSELSNLTAPTNSTGFQTVVNTTSVSAYIQINDTNLYSIWAISCSEDEFNYDGAAIVNGPIVLSNVYGYLPGQIAPLEVFWWILFVCYLIWLCVWVRLVTRYNQTLHVIQHVITLVLVLSLLENMLSASSYVSLNVKGEDNLGLNIFIFVVTTFKSTLSFVGLLLVAMGYAITRPKLTPPQKACVWIVGIIYLIVEFVYQCLNMIQNTSQTQGLYVNPNAVSLFAILLILMTFVFITLIYIFLFRTLMELKGARAGKKYIMFLNLAKILAVAVFVSIVLFIIELAATTTGQVDNWWKGWWVFTAYWDFLHLCLIVPISFLWRPNNENKRYAYDETEPTLGPQVVELEVNPESSFTPHPDSKVDYSNQI